MHYGVTLHIFPLKIPFFDMFLKKQTKKTWFSINVGDIGVGSAQVADLLHAMWFTNRVETGIFRYELYRESSCCFHQLYSVTGSKYGLCVRLCGDGSEIGTRSRRSAEVTKTDTREGTVSPAGCLKALPNASRKKCAGIRHAATSTPSSATWPATALVRLADWPRKMVSTSSAHHRNCTTASRASFSIV